MAEPHLAAIIESKGSMSLRTGAGRRQSKCETKIRIILAFTGGAVPDPEELILGKGPVAITAILKLLVIRFYPDLVGDK